MLLEPIYTLGIHNILCQWVLKFNYVLQEKYILLFVLNLLPRNFILFCIVFVLWKTVNSSSPFFVFHVFCMLLWISLHSPLNSQLNNFVEGCPTEGLTKQVGSKAGMVFLYGKKKTTKNWKLSLHFLWKHGMYFIHFIVLDLQDSVFLQNKHTFFCSHFLVFFFSPWSYRLHILVYFDNDDPFGIVE